MESLTICLPDFVMEKAKADALRREIDLTSYVSGIVADHFLGGIPRTASVEPQLQDIHSEPNVIEARSETFRVADYFPNFPSGSVAFAQRFVDETLKFPGVTAFQVRRGVGFRPNFVFIEYLMSRGGRPGIGVSFYGEPTRHRNPPQHLVRGIPSYSRAKIYSEADLNAIIPHIRQSYELKFGSQ